MPGLPALPALGESCSLLGIRTIWLSEVISSGVVEFSTQATDIISVSGWQVDLDSTSVVICDRKAKVGSQFNSSGVALDVDSAIAEAEWKPPPDPINLKKSVTFRLQF